MKFTCETVIRALTEYKGMVYLTANVLRCAPQTIYNYIERYPSVRAAWEAQHGEVGDIAELKLYHAITHGEHWAIAFYLRTKGKGRGYTERQEVTGADGGRLQVEIEYVNDWRGEED